MKFVNPLAKAKAPSVSSTEEKTESISGTLDIDNSGNCPKCKKPMGTAIIKNGSTVMYCKSCRVSMPVAS